MTPAMQVKLYRVLQEHKVRPLGSNEEIEVDVRVIAATNKDLEKEIAGGNFREDLYYRLSVIPIHLPPLRERREDIPLLARAFLERFRKSMEKAVEGLEPHALRLLEAYDWPGNVRELENTIERAVALESGKSISVKSLPDKISSAVVAAGSLATEESKLVPPEGLDFDKRIAEIERAYLRGALSQSGGVGTRAAELLRISYRSFKHYAKKYKL